MNKTFFTGLFVSLFLTQIPFIGQSQISSNPTTGVLSTQYGVWSVVSNPAGLANTAGFNSGFYYQSAFLMHQLSDAGFALAFPAGKLSVIGLSYQQFGYSLYKEQKAAFLLSKQLGKLISTGVRFDYLNIAFGNDYGKESIITGSAGIIIKVTDELRAGLYVFNPQRVKYSDNSGTRYPGRISCGITWRFGSHVELSLGAEKESDNKEIITCAIDYAISSKFKLHAGVGSGGKPFYFGYSFRAGRFEFSMNSGYHELLGFSPQVILTYKQK